MSFEGKDTSHKGEKVHAYDLGYKIKVIEFAKNHGNHAASRNFSVDRKRVREWRQKEDNIRETSESKGKTICKRLRGAGRKIVYDTIESDVLQWLKQRRINGVRVTGKALKNEARRLHTIQGNQAFKGSCGWLRRFMKRNKVCFRRSTHVAQKSEEILGDRMHGFLSFVTKQRRRQGYPIANIGNMDETPVWIDMPGDYTLETKGVKTVTMGSTGHEKSRITVCLAAMGDGTKLPPLVLWKGVRPLKDVPLGIYVQMTPAAWANEAVIEQWLKLVWRRQSTRRLLVWDAFSAHRTKNIKEKLSIQYNTDMAVIPGGCTSKLQPCDVSWNKPFKDAYKDAYDEWLMNGKRELTKGGNRKPPEKGQVLRWVKSSWDNVSPEVIRKSFVKTGICSAMDGSEDDQLFAESDNEDPFDGYDEQTAGDAEGNKQLLEAVNLEIDALNEWSEDENEAYGSDEDASDSDYVNDSSPGH